MPCTFDDTKRPLLYFRWDGAVTDDEMAVFLQQWEKVMARKQAWLTIIDLTAVAKNPTPKQMNMQSDMLKKNADLIRKYSLGNVFVVSSGLVRTVLRGVLLFHPPEDPYVVVSSLDEGVTWANTAFEKAGIPFPGIPAMASSAIPRA